VEAILMPQFHLPHRPRAAHRLSAALIGAALIAASVGGPVAAASQTKTTTLHDTGSSSPAYSFDVSGVCDQCVPDVVKVVLGSGSWAYGVTASATVGNIAWTPSDSVAGQFDDNNLRQGRTLDLTDTLSHGGGTIVATGAVSGSGGLLNDPSGGTNWQASGGSTDINAPATWTATNCVLPLPSEGTATCTSNTQDVELLSQTVASLEIGDLKLVLSAKLSLTFTIDSDGTVVARSLTFNGVPGSLDRVMTFTAPALADPIAMPCTVPAGTEVDYALHASDTTPATSVTGAGTLHAEAVFSPPVLPDVDVFGGDIATIAAPSHDAGLSLTGDTGTEVLGTLAPNNIPPTADAGGGATHAYDGVEGTPIVFDGSGSASPCGFPTLRWDFSDGGVAFGRNPEHTFEGPGIYSGLVTATDVTGLSATQAFSVDVGNLAPVVAAGPDTTSAWGRNVAFNGAATDPGTADQSTLTYSWWFGDGTPSATGGPSVTHAYATPGTYTATFQACDRWNACASDTRDVVVRARNVSVGNLGDTAATFDTGAHLSASLVDEYGQPVNGRTITFAIGVSPAGSAVTNSSGVGATAWTPEMMPGTYATSAEFGGDSLYTAASGSGSITIARKATTTTYTGALSGGPNKTITVSATLVDATGEALAGRMITFQLGSQTASALTTATGVASVHLKLKQKNGTYPLTATWAPAGTDALDYVGSAASATFKLQAK
jgi:PKD domain